MKKRLLLFHNMSKAKLINCKDNFKQQRKVLNNLRMALIKSSQSSKNYQIAMNLSDFKKKEQKNWRFNWLQFKKKSVSSISN